MDEVFQVEAPTDTTFQVPESGSLLPENQFRFRLPGSDQVHAIPKIQFLPASFQHRMAKLAPEIQRVERGGTPSVGSLAQLSGVYLDVLEDLVPGITDQLSQDQVQKLVQGWQAASNVTVGESVASPS